MSRHLQRRSSSDALRPSSIPTNARPRSMNSTPPRNSESSSDTSSQLPPSLNETLTARGSGSEALSTSVSGLEALKSVLEAVDTLPFVKILASIGIQLLTYIIDAQITNDLFKGLAFRAKDVIVAVARACDGMNSIADRLEQDLKQLTDAMNAILAFATEKTKRRTYRKIFSKSDDAVAVRELDIQLTHSFQIFEIQSSVSSRRMQHELAQQLRTFSPVAAPNGSEFIPDVTLRVEEGIYLIRNAASGRVIETDAVKPHDRGAHVYLASSLDGRAQTQLWSVQRSSSHGFLYEIRSIATGLVLDIHLDSSRQGEKVVCHGTHGGKNQQWSFWGTRPGMMGDFCTIRSGGHPTVLDSVCPKNTPTCDELHATHITPNGHVLSQEWNLISLTSSRADAPTPALHLPMITLPRRPLLLQNVLTGTYATRSEDLEGPNVLLTPSALSRSSWTFFYSRLAEDLQIDCFNIVTSSRSPCTLDHYGGLFINVSNFWPTNAAHQWVPSARDGAFVFRNVGSGTLLASSRSSPGLVETMPISARDDPACHWRLIDPSNKEQVRVIYDSSFSVMPPELVGQPTLPPPQPSRAPLTLNAGTASPDMFLGMMRSYEQEHKVIRDLLQEGCKALVVAPRMISGWRDGLVRRVAVWDDEAEFSERKFITIEGCYPS